MSTKAIVIIALCIICIIAALPLTDFLVRHHQTPAPLAGRDAAGVLRAIDGLVYPIEFIHAVEADRDDMSRGEILQHWREWWPAQDGVVSRDLAAAIYEDLIDQALEGRPAPSLTQFLDVVREHDPVVADLLRASIARESHRLRTMESP